MSVRVGSAAAFTLLLSALILFAPVLVQAQPARPAAGNRVALVVGNGNYREGPVRSALNDARAVAGELRQAGFETSIGENLSQQELQRAIATFKQKIKADSLAVFYFSGYAIQLARQNFMIPVDAQIASAPDVNAKGVNVQTVLDGIPGGRTGPMLVILDASRRNPFEQKFRGFSAGLAAAQAPAGTAIALAAGPGKVAPDRPGESSLYTSELLETLRAPGRRIEDVFDKVRADVSRITNGEQVPWESSALTAPVVLSPGAPSPSAQRPATPPAPSAQRPSTPPAAAAAPAGSPDPFELSFWESIRDSKNAADFRAYLQTYPNGRFAPLARLRADDAAPGPSASLQASPAPASPGPERSIQRPATAASDARKTGDVFRDCPDCPEMVALPGGSFEMGANDFLPFEKPRHPVSVRPFAMGLKEVTFQEWDRCAAAGACKYQPSDRGWGRGDRPVINVSWTDAKEFAAWLSQATGQKYRLPSEAEWEYAARGGTSTPFWWGREAGADRANCATCGSRSNGQTAPAGSFPANAFGLVDTAGNAAEWVEDCWRDTYRGAPSDGSAWVAAQCRERVLRGGSFASDPTYLRSSARFKYDIDVRYYANGFRLARDLP